MENNELFNQIKSAAENAETNDFPGMEKVWNRVEEKLDKKADKKAIGRWKKIAVAASLLLLTTIGYQFFKDNPKESKPSEVITSNDTIKKTDQTKEVVTAEPTNPAIKKEALQILQKQINHSSSAAMSSVKEADDKVILDSVYTNQMGYFSSPSKVSSSVSRDDYKNETKKEYTKPIEMFSNNNSRISTVQKEEPLVVIDDKVKKENLKDIRFNEADSLVVLNEPLYIINGAEYTEQEVFGPNPTSPYTPLNKQEIETISILQDEKAVEIYGNKGKKGVVIITTKNGKPVTASKKAK